MRSMSARHARYASSRWAALAAHTTAISPTSSGPGGARRRARPPRCRLDLGEDRLISATAIDGYASYSSRVTARPSLWSRTVPRKSADSARPGRTRRTRAIAGLLEARRGGRLTGRPRRGVLGLLRVARGAKLAALATALRLEANRLDGRPPIGALDHVVGRQRRDGRGDQRLHLDAGAVHRLDGGRHAEPPPATSISKSTDARVVCTGWQQRDELRAYASAPGSPRCAPRPARRPWPRARSATASTTSRVVRTQAVATARRREHRLRPTSTM